MILLRRLQAPALKHLRDIDLWFPRRGSVLIEGANEAGKSTIFEAIYFALYGAPLVGEETPPALQALLPHDASAASVTLWLSTESAELEIHRSVQMGKRVIHQAQLTLRRAGAAPEHIHGARAVSDRVLLELHGLDGDALRNSCLMEQQALDRIEALSRGQREDAVAKLLGLQRLRQIEHELAPAGDDRAELTRAQRAMALAERRQQAQEATLRAGRAGMRERAVTLREAIAARDERDAERATQRDELLACEGQIAVLDDTVRWAQQAEELRERLRASEHEYSAAVEARAASVREDERRNEIECITRDELPAARALLAEVGALEAELARAQAHAVSSRAALQLATAATETAATAARARAALVAAEQIADAARATAVRAQGYEALAAWVQRAEATTFTDGDETALAQATRVRDAVATALNTAQRRTRQTWGLATLAGVIALGSAAGGLVLHALWGLALLALLALVALAGRVRALAATAARATTDHARQQQAVLRLETRRELALGLAAGSGTPAQLEAVMRAAGIAPPDTADAGRAALAALPAMRGNTEHLLAAAQEAALAVERCRADLGMTERSAQAAYAAWTGSDAASASLPPSVPVLTQAMADAAGEVARVSARVRAMGIAAEPSALAARRGMLDGRIAELEERARALSASLDAPSSVPQQAGAARAALVATLVTCAQQAAAIGIIPAQHTAAAAAASEATTAGGPLEALERQRVALARAVAEALDERGATQARERLAVCRQRRETLATSLEETSRHLVEATARIRALLADCGVAVTGTEPLERLITCWAPLGEVDAAMAAEVRAEVEHATREADYHSRSADELAREQALDDGEVPDVDTCRARVARIERTLRQRDLAALLAREVRERIVRRVLPETRAHMCVLLPELTAGRYRDVSLLHDDAGTGADLRLRVWDALAGRYVAKNLFSGGTRDQCSLALRLAFALATLPKELGAIPGFIFLDEPLSSFDDERAQALVYVLTRGEIARQFDQVVLISHSQAFDPGNFQHTLRMSGGRVVESSLPAATEAGALWQAEAGVAVAHL